MGSNTGNDKNEKRYVSLIFRLPKHEAINFRSALAKKDIGVQHICRVIARHITGFVFVSPDSEGSHFRDFLELLILEAKDEKELPRSKTQ